MKYSYKKNVRSSLDGEVGAKRSLKYDGKLVYLKKLHNYREQTQTNFIIFQIAGNS